MENQNTGKDIADALTRYLKSGDTILEGDEILTFEGTTPRWIKVTEHMIKVTIHHDAAYLRRPKED